MKTKRDTLKMFWLIAVVGLVSCEQSRFQEAYPEAFVIVAENPSDIARNDAAVFLDLKDIEKQVKGFNSGAFVVLQDDSELPSQAVDLNGDGLSDRIVVVGDFLPEEQKDLTVRYARNGERVRDYPKRTQAELSHKFGGRFEERKYIGGTFRNVNAARVPPEHTDHSLFFRYEGPGWESDKVGYRFYLDWRNAIDIFGKKVSNMVLQDVGQDGFDSYHEMADWGMDILKVGESLGIGSIGMWHEGNVYRVSETDSIRCRIVANGSVYSHIRTEYFGWQVGANQFNLVSNLAITAGSRMTEHSVLVGGQPDNLCTGLVKHEDATVLRDESQDGEWGYLATFGKQSLSGDRLGMAILYQKSQRLDFAKDDVNHLLVLKPNGNHVRYYFLAAWEQEPNGIKSEAEFRTYLDQKIAELSHPVEVVFSNE